MHIQCGTISNFQLKYFRGSKYDVDPELKEILGVVCENQDTQKKTGKFSFINIF